MGNPALLRHLVIEGPIGSGKTTLAHRLARHLDADLLLEQPQANPFLERFYKDRPRYALPTQLCFLLQRVAQLAELEQRDASQRPVVADFLFDKDALFAQLNLAGDELRLYQTIHERVAPRSGAPDLVVYLQARPEILAERVARRADPIETGISEAYLRALGDRYAEFFHHYEAAPVLIVNSEHFNPTAREEDLRLLLERMQTMRGRREYFSVG